MALYKAPYVKAKSRIAVDSYSMQHAALTAVVAHNGRGFALPRHSNGRNTRQWVNVGRWH